MTDESKSNTIRMDSLANYLSGLGTSDDATTHAKPTLDHRLTDIEVKKLWSMDDLARRIVDEVVEDAVRGGWTARHAETGDQLDDAGLKLDKHLQKGGIRGRRDGTAFVWIVTERGGRSIDQPLDDSETVVNLVVLDRDEVTPFKWENDPRNEHYDEPVVYHLTPHANAGVVDAEFQALEVHRSRLMRFEGNDLPDEFDFQDEDYGDSVLQSVWSAIRRFTQTEQAIANIVQRFETATISIAGLAEAASTKEGAELIQKRMALFQKSMSMVNAAIVDKDAGEDYTRKFATVNGLEALWDRLAHSVSKAAKMPMTQLFGMSPSGLSSDDESGKANWRKQVASYQTEQFHDNLVAFYSAVHGVPVEIEFHPLDETTAEAESEINEREAKAITTLVKSNVITPEQGRKRLVNIGYLRSGEVDPNPDADAFERLAQTDAWRTDPYPSAESVPQHVPEDKADQWRNVWNQVFDETGDEKRAYRVANDVI